MSDLDVEAILDEYCELSDGKVLCKKSYHKSPKGEFPIYWMQDGHGQISVKGCKILIHRAIFYLNNGWLPEFIDHKDMDPRNNSIGNLRPATKATNSWNRGVQSNSSTGVRGVTYNSNPKSVNKWGAYIKVNGKREWLGSFPTCEEAEAAYAQRVATLNKSGEIVI